MAPGRCEYRNERDPLSPEKTLILRSSTWKTTGKSHTGWRPIDVHSPFFTARSRRPRHVSAWGAAARLVRNPKNGRELLTVESDIEGAVHPRLLQPAGSVCNVR